MNCDGARILIDAYMDAELDGTRMAEMDSHMTTCESCRRMLDARRELSKAIKVATVYVPAPASLRDQIRRRTQAKPPVRRWQLTAGVCLAAVAGIAFALTRPQPPKKVDMIGDMLADHSVSVGDGHLVDIASANPRTLQDWFTVKVDYRPRVPILSSKGYDLVGGRLDKVGHDTVPVLVYTHGSHKIDVFVTPIGDYKIADADSRGWHVRSWSDCGIGYWAVSDDNASRVGDFITTFGANMNPSPRPTGKSSRSGRRTGLGR